MKSEKWSLCVDEELNMELLKNKFFWKAVHFKEHKRDCTIWARSNPDFNTGKEAFENGLSFLERFKLSKINKKREE